MKPASNSTITSPSKEYAHYLFQSMGKEKKKLISPEEKDWKNLEFSHFCAVIKSALPKASLDISFLSVALSAEGDASLFEKCLVRFLS